MAQLFTITAVKVTAQDKFYAVMKAVTIDCPELGNIDGKSLMFNMPLVAEEPARSNIGMNVRLDLTRFRMQQSAFSFAKDDGEIVDTKYWWASIPTDKRPAGVYNDRGDETTL